MGRPIWSEPRCLLSIDDLAEEEIDGLLVAARDTLTGRSVEGPGRHLTVGLLFLTASLRTRLAFSVATVRLGGQAIDVAGTRWQPGMSEAESFADTLRVVSGMVDIVVVRGPFALERNLVSRVSVAPLVSAGDGVEHPTQAIVDLLAIEEERGGIQDLHVGICGDVCGRSARSLVKLFERRLPRRLTLMAPPERCARAAGIEGPLADRTAVLDRVDLHTVDVLYMAGLVEGRGPDRLDDERRDAFALTPARLAKLPDNAVVLSPLPLIDEVSAEARRDPRIRWFPQSDRGVAVRMAVLQMLR